MEVKWEGEEWRRVREREIVWSRRERERGRRGGERKGRVERRGRRGVGGVW